MSRTFYGDDEGRAATVRAPRKGVFKQEHHRERRGGRVQGSRIPSFEEFFQWLQGVTIEK